RESLEGPNAAQTAALACFLARRHPHNIAPATDREWVRVALHPRTPTRGGAIEENPSIHLIRQKQRGLKRDP
ncbi:hypothetical protein, partial [Escherichia coli]|uniref:hypothetical protein n=1 Tax=Escherichia coli TaxID=562 RepID=UPI001F4A6B40